MADGLQDLVSKALGSNPAPGADVPVEVKGNTGAAERLVMRTWWYRDQYRRLTKIMLVLVAAVLIEAVIIGWLGVSKPAPRYVGLTTDGRAIELKPLGYPYPDSLVAGWAARAVQEIYSYNYIDYRKRLNEDQRPFFTSAGFKSYMASLERERTIETVRDLRYVVSGTAVEMPVVLKRDTSGGQVRWHLQAKVLVRFDSVNTSNAKPQTLIVDLWVVRVPENVVSAGLQIERMVSAVAR